MHALVFSYPRKLGRDARARGKGQQGTVSSPRDVHADRDARFDGKYGLRDHQRARVHHRGAWIRSNHRAPRKRDAREIAHG